MVEYIEKKSRFLGFAMFTSKEAEAREYISKIAALHKKANHVAYSYVCVDGARMFDDGEPKGTAGFPIYSLINRRNLDNIVIIVVRYFGGTMLGRGGLVRAYSKTAGLAADWLKENSEKEGGE